MIPTQTRIAVERPKTPPQIPPGVVVHRLDNGLELIIREDRSSPVVSAQAWCRAGSVDEGRWIGGGLSHVLEHMLFKGTTTRGAGRIDQEVQAAGGYINAYTSFDRTVYWINVPDTGAKVAVDILCDIFQNATLPADDLVKELDVIRREMDMGEDDPGRRSSKGLFSTAYVRSPYRYPVIGLPGIFNRITREDVVAYYKEKYAPNNCFLVVVGNIQPADVIAQVTAGFGSAQAGAVSASVLPMEAPQTAPRETLAEAPLELCHFHMGWHIPEMRHHHIPALDVLSTLLGSGRSSRLYRSVRERSALVHSVNAWIYTPTLGGLFGVSGVCDGSKYSAARDEILAEINRMAFEPLNPGELAKAVKQFTAGMLSSRKTMEGQAQDLGGNWMAAYDLNFSERYLEAVKRVGAEDLQRVVRTYLTDSNRTIFSLLPKGLLPAMETAAESGVDHPIQQFVFSNGLRLLVKEDHRLPFVQFRLALSGGLLAETPSDSGMTSMLSRLLIKGTTTRSAEEIADTIEGLGGSLEAYGGNHSFGLSAEVLKEDFAMGLELFTDVLLNPTFPKLAFEREREAQLASIRGERDQLLHCAFKSMRRGLFGESGYGLDGSGTEESIRRLSSEDLKSFHQRMAVPNNGVLAIYGDIDTATIREVVEAALAGWQPTPIPALPKCSSRGAIARFEERRDKEQAVIALGFPGTTFDAPDRFALELLQEACSDMGSRLFMRIRDELGFAYYVGASNFPGRVAGYFAFYCGTAPDHVDLVEVELRSQAEKLRTEGLTAVELERAKAKVIGQRKIARQDLGQFALATALDELYGLGFLNFETENARIEAVTLEEVLAATARHLIAENAVVSIIRGN
ncbi:MAG: insulinase family protein [Pedosphaera sp.]|nr:insulinase family protein [Pedosphaera sp.]